MMERMRSRRSSNVARDRLGKSESPPGVETRPAGGSWWLLVPLGVALLARLLALRWQPYVTFDGTEYIQLAESLRAGKLIPSLFPPGYPFLIACGTWLLGDAYRSAVAISLLAGCLSVVPVWHLAHRHRGLPSAMTAAMIVALHPVLIHFSVLTMSESMFLLTTCAGMACLEQGRGLLSGLSFGVAFATRPEAVILALVGAGREFVLSRRHGRTNRAALLLLLGFGLVAAPCLVYFRVTTGVWTPTPKISALHAPVLDWRSAEPRAGSGFTTSNAERFGVWERLGGEGRAALRNYPRNAWAVMREVAVNSPPLLSALALVGTIAVGLGVHWGVAAYLVSLPLLGLSFQPRFALLLAPSVAVLASAAVHHFRQPVVRALGLASLLAGMLWCCAQYLPELTSPFDGDVGPAMRAGRWVGADGPPGARVMSRKPFVAFYAGRGNVILPDEPYDAIIAAARAHGVRYLVVEERLVETMRPQLAPLIRDREFLEREARLELAYVGGDAPGYGIAVFRVLGSGERKSGRSPVVALSWRR